MARQDAAQVRTNTLLRRLFDAPDLGEFMEQNADSIRTPQFHEYISELCRTMGQVPERVIRQSSIERTYGHQVFNGTRKPSRDKVIQTAFGFLRADVVLVSWAALECSLKDGSRTLSAKLIDAGGNLLIERGTLFNNFGTLTNNGYIPVDDGGQLNDRGGPILNNGTIDLASCFNGDITRITGTGTLNDKR